MMRVADYIVDFLYKRGIGHIFLLTGGGAMHLNDALAKHGQMKYVCHHHEQAAAMAAEAYARARASLGVAMVTTGPGATNAITGALGAWLDSAPCLILSGQSKRKETIANAKIPDFRQFGVQEVDIIPMIKNITKYAAMVNEPEKIRYHLEKAFYLATQGRPGPVWLDIPTDVQGALINPKKLIGFKPPKNQIKISSSQVLEVINLLKEAKKPLIVAGSGIRIAGAIEDFLALVKTLKIPVVVSALGLDVIEYNHPFFLGKMGTKGTRAANIALQNADLILAIGSRLSVSSIGFEYEKFAPQAKKIVVDIDETDHQKKTIKIDLFIKADAKDFIQELSRRTKDLKFNFNKEWPEKCRQLKDQYPVCLPEYAKVKSPINMYLAVDRIFEQLNKDDIVITDAGNTFYVATQGAKIKKGQRFIISGGIATMGYNLPASIGAGFASPKKRIICITGDGSFQMNIHELATIAYHRLPIKIFVLNNQGYLAIRTTQNNFFQRLIGIDEETGIGFPDLKKIAYAYGIKFYKINQTRRLEKTISKVLSFKGPTLCEIVCPNDQKILAVASRRLEDGRMESTTIDDMFPFLPRLEFEKIKKDLA